MTTYDWLLFFHLLGALLFLGGAVTAGLLNLNARRRDRPSEIAILLGATRAAVALVGAGSLAVLVFGLWLAHYQRYSFSEGWLVASIAFSGSPPRCSAVSAAGSSAAPASSPSDSPPTATGLRTSFRAPSGPGRAWRSAT